MALEPPLRPFRCRETDCDFPLGGRCSRLFADPASECEELVRLAPRPAAEQTGPEGEQQALPPDDRNDADNTAAPWTGTHLAYGRLASIATRTVPRLVGVLGPHDAGKTSLLASLFLQIANGQYGAFPYRFAASKTLLAFDNLILRANQWTGKPDTQILEHTPKTNSSEFLHLGLRPLSKTHDAGLEPRLVDVLISDIAGETTSSWSRNAVGEAAATMAFVRHSHALLVLADAQRLMELTGRAYDAEIAGVLRRVATVIRNAALDPCVAIVFTKVDLVPDVMRKAPQATIPYEPETWKQLLRAGAIRSAVQALAQQGTRVAAFSASAFPTPMSHGQPSGVIAPFQYAIEWADRGVRLMRPRADPTTSMPSIARYAAVRQEWE